MTKRGWNFLAIYTLTIFSPSCSADVFLCGDLPLHQHFPFFGCASESKTLRCKGIPHTPLPNIAEVASLNF